MQAIPPAWTPFLEQKPKSESPDQGNYRMKTNNTVKRNQDNFGWVPVILGLLSAIGDIACQIEVRHTDLFERPGKYIALELGGGLLEIASLIFLAMTLINIGLMRWDLFLYNRKLRKWRAKHPRARRAPTNSLSC